MSIPDWATFKARLQARLAGWRSPAAIGLIAANLPPVFCVLIFDWSARPVLAIYWFELLVVGVLNTLKFIFASPASILGWFFKIITLPFTMMIFLPYLMLLLLFGVIVFGAMAPDMATRQAFVSFVFFWSNAGEALPLDTAGLILWRGFDLPTQVSVVVLAASHVFSLVWQLFGRGEREPGSIDQSFLLPLLRAFVMLTAVFVALGSIEAMGAEPPRAVLIIIIGAKTIFDLATQLASPESGRPKVPVPPPATVPA